MVEALAPGSPPTLVSDAFNMLWRALVHLGAGRGHGRPGRAGQLDLSPFEHEVFALDAVNEAIDAIAHRSGGFTNIPIRHR